MIGHPAFRPEPWALREITLDPAFLAQSESIFALANGVDVRLCPANSCRSWVGSRSRRWRQSMWLTPTLNSRPPVR